ncbi:RCS-specific HTH-type transcriptional activator RclR [Pseudidiomarina piscicola]|uniref:RCS-specific HTH-type transcriptional activator RclR n=1 Tax=Pseudidiomarina piscicola TaxID=2614830 RepID=A0A6S6WLP4_9GAMM|nr:AraC family transcriptional regulator [Pseudidiomarina piscicola]CAB0150899.1 RCS-specific HTH-type transcriptional activator RclR [Pseudidiomarina piscicola]VZT40405.1 RCS-specific HTH-type transcriptional activator RclR [Pseudomonas aeruginosa]
MTETPEQPTKTTESVEALITSVAQGTELHFETGLCGDWSILADHPGKVGLHIVSNGECWLGFPASAQPTQRLSAGDAVFVNQGVSHFLSRQEVPAQVSLDELKNYCTPNHAESGVICYELNEVNETSTHFFGLLPPWMVLRTTEQTEELATILAMIRRETLSGKPGYQTIISRLSDVLAVHLLRQIVAQEHQLNGVFAGLNDSSLLPVLNAILKHPERDWSVDAMANIACLSVSAFADRCQRATGLTPKKILDQLRFQRAKYLLSTTSRALEVVAADVGYQSNTAFGRFFKKYANCSALEYRAKL